MADEAKVKQIGLALVATITRMHDEINATPEECTLAAIKVAIGCARGLTLEIEESKISEEIIRTLSENIHVN